MTPRLQTDILRICFSFQTGFCPTAVSHTLATGYGYSLRWEDSVVTDMNSNRTVEFERAKQVAKAAPRKKKVDNSLTKLTDALEVFSDYDKNDFTLLKYGKIEVVTPKAALIDGVWYPKSQMKVDTDNGLWLSNWLYEKNFK